MISGARWFPFLSLWLGLGFVVNAPAPAMDEENAYDDIEVVVTIGTRASARAASDAAVPVDVFTLDDLESVNSSDMVDVINTIVPSFNVTRQPISDGASFIRPVSLRGLDSHHSLVLVNGKRRHRAALMPAWRLWARTALTLAVFLPLRCSPWKRSGTSAAAQYGSDAIAGVINFKLRENHSGYELRGKYGGYTEGDGEEVTVEANAGFALGSKGFISISGQYSDTQPSSRSQSYGHCHRQFGADAVAGHHSRLTVDGVTYFGPDAFTYTYGADGTIEQVLPGSDGVPDDLDTRFADNFTGVGGDREFDSPAQIWGQPEREQGAFLCQRGAAGLGDIRTVWLR